MEDCVKAFLNKKGYDVNDKALTIIHVMTGTRTD
mgnify:CR=1 FL=1